MSNKRLYLSRDKVIGGVAGGIAEYFDVDPTIVRLIWALAIFSGVGVLVYIAAMIIIPERPAGDFAHTEDEPQEQEVIDELKQAARQLTETGGEAASEVAQKIRGSIERLNQTTDHPQPKEEQPSKDSQRNLGLVLLIVGLFFLTRNFWPWIPWNLVWPVLIIVLGISLFLKGLGDR